MVGSSRRALLVSVLLGASACASVPPERAAEDDVMWEAARECKARYTTIDSIDRIDSFGRLHYTCRGSCPDTTGFLTCYQTVAQRKLEAAKLSGTGRVADATTRKVRTTVPVKLSGSSAFASVMVNDAQTGDMLVDTGASSTILSPAFAERLGIVVPRNARRRVLTVAGGSTITVPFVRVQSVSVGDFTVEALDVGVYDIFPAVRAVAGVLGTDFLQHFRASVDTVARSLTLETRLATVASAPARPSHPAVVDAARPLGSVTAPSWTVGDEWSFRWESPRGSGTFVYRVSRAEAVDGVDYWVLTSGRRDSYFRKTDLAYVFAKVGGDVEERLVPAQLHFLWPLTVGGRWDNDYTREVPKEQRTEPRALTVAVEGEETIEVPAGTYRALKIVRRHRATGNLSYEGWYAPAVKHWVRLRETFSYGVRTRDLVTYKPAT